jgi:hypothetical protein
LALTYLERAALEDDSERRWLRLADAASRQGHHARAIDALTKVARRHRNDAKLLVRIDAERRKLLASGAGIDSK